MPLKIPSASLFRIFSQGLEHASLRTRVASQNLSGLQQPGYRTQAVVPFSHFLVQDGQLKSTHPQHLQPRSAPGRAVQSTSSRVRTYQGNDVALKEQLMELNKAGSDHLQLTNMARAFLGYIDHSLSIKE